MRIFVYFEQCVFFEMHFRAYFDSYELERKRIISKLNHLTIAQKSWFRLLVVWFAFLFFVLHSTIMWMYWTDQVELLIVLLTAVLEYSVFSFCIVSIMVSRNTYFSGCAYLNKIEKLRLRTLARKIRYWNIAFFFDLLFYLYVIWDGSFNTVDMIPYVSGSDAKSKLNLFRSSILYCLGYKRCLRRLYTLLWRLQSRLFLHLRIDQ